MTESEKNDLLERLSRIRKETELQQRRKTVLLIKKEQLQKEIDRINQKIIELGSSPETVEEDIQREYEEKLREISEAEKILEENERLLLEAEKHESL